MAEKLDQRYTYPTEADSYYFDNSINPYAYGENLMPNCTTYAYGRFLESGGSPTVFGGSDNAGKWYPYAKGSKGKTPKVGAILCHEKSGAFGHVAFVEEIVSDNEIIVSDSQYIKDKTIDRNSDIYWRRRSRKNDDGHWGGGGYPNYVFQGFIYNTEEFDNTPTGGSSGGGGDSSGGNEGGDTGGGDTGGGDTSGGSTNPNVVLNNVQSTYGNAHYIVSLTSSNRTSNSVTVKCSVTATTSSSVSGTITCGLYIGGTWHDFTLVSGTWTGTTFAGSNIVVTGLSPSQTSITEIQFRAVSSATNNSGGLNATPCADLIINAYGDSGGSSGGGNTGGGNTGGTVTVTFYPNGSASIPYVYSVTSGSTIKLISCPESFETMAPDGASFNGWGTSSSGGNIYSAGASYTVYQDTSFYAIWTGINSSGPQDYVAVTIYGNITVKLIRPNFYEDGSDFIYETFTESRYISNDRGVFEGCRLVVYPEIGNERIDCIINGEQKTYFDVNRQGVSFEVKNFIMQVSYYSFFGSPIGNAYIDNGSDLNSYQCLIDTNGSGFDYYIPYVTVENNCLFVTEEIYANRHFNTAGVTFHVNHENANEGKSITFFDVGNVIVTNVLDMGNRILLKGSYLGVSGSIDVGIKSTSHFMYCVARARLKVDSNDYKAGDIVTLIKMDKMGNFETADLITFSLDKLEFLPYGRYKWEEMKI